MNGDYENPNLLVTNSLDLCFTLISCHSAQTQIKEANTTSSASLPIDKYKLDMSIEGLNGLTEFSETDYLIYGRNFDGEVNYHAPDVMIFNRQWKVDIGTVKGRVYKIAFYFESESRDTVIDVSADMVRYIQQKLGKPSEQNDTDFIWIWDTPDGNVLMQFGRVETTYMINLFETSRIVKSFLPRK
jgi:hypothetical protein